MGYFLKAFWKEERHKVVPVFPVQVTELEQYAAVYCHCRIDNAAEHIQWTLLSSYDMNKASGTQWYLPSRRDEGRALNLASVKIHLVENRWHAAE